MLTTRGLSYGATYRDNDEHYEVFLDLPGVDAENLLITCEDGLLSVQGSRVYPKEIAVHKAFTVPKDISPEDISAAYTNGVLTLRMLKPSRLRKTVIPVQKEPSYIPVST